MILCQACDNYAQGHQARSSYPWRERINHDFVLYLIIVFAKQRLLVRAVKYLCLTSPF